MNFGFETVDELYVQGKEVQELYVGGKKAWEKAPVEVNALTFTAEQANSTIRLDKVGTPPTVSLEYSTDGQSWTDYTWSNKTGATLTMAEVGDKVYMRAKDENLSGFAKNTN